MSFQACLDTIRAKTGKVLTNLKNWQRKKAF